MIAPACMSRTRFRFALVASVLAPTVFVAIPAAAQPPTFPTSATNPLPPSPSNLNGAQLTLMFPSEPDDTFKRFSATQNAGHYSVQGAPTGANVNTSGLSQIDVKHLRVTLSFSGSFSSN